ncbi:MAG: 4-hydroxy-tetrahydrodipicolinate synthase [Psychromonas sp.]|nr:4-hydroxy-tetrahydrodipicolinate synthase [Psychromonas sp.]
MLKGSIVALVTPLKKNKEIDFSSLRKLVEYHIKSGTSAIVAVGTTGESSTLNVDDHIKVVMNILKFSDGKIDVIAGNGANSTSEAIVLSKLLSGTNITAGLNVTPYYNKPTQEGLYQHYKLIAESSDLPQILYNVPSRTGIDLLPETVGRLAKLSNIIGIKDATGDLNRLNELQAVVPESFSLYSGDDLTGCEFILNGGHGIISVSSNIAAADMANMCKFALAHKVEEARKINQQLTPIHSKLFIESNPIPVKWACAELGLIPTAVCRLPLTTLAPQYHSIVRDALIKSQIIL